MLNRTILILGAGPGIGRSVATLFASKRFRNVVLIARSAEHLAAEKAAVENAVGAHQVSVRTYAVDTTHTQDLLAALDDADAAFGKPELVFYNAARVQPSAFFTHPLEDMEYEIKIAVSALYIVAQRYVPHLVALASAGTNSRPALVVTSSALPLDPIPQLFALSAAKAAQRNLAQSLSLTYGGQGVHVGVVNVMGPVSPGDEVRNPTEIARRTWEWLEGARGREGDWFEVKI